ncbi:MAG: hypothetical protein R3F11_29230 [Verrucomicrobiales bacterium]
MKTEPRFYWAAVAAAAGLALSDAPCQAQDAAEMAFANAEAVAKALEEGRESDAEMLAGAELKAHAARLLAGYSDETAEDWEALDAAPMLRQSAEQYQIGEKLLAALAPDGAADAAAHMEFGAVCELLGDEERAAAAYGKALSLDAAGASGKVRVRLAYVLADSDPVRAVGLLGDLEPEQVAQSGQVIAGALDQFDLETRVAAAAAVADLIEAKPALIGEQPWWIAGLLDALANDPQDGTPLLYRKNPAPGGGSPQGVDPALAAAHDRICRAALGNPALGEDAFRRLAANAGSGGDGLPALARKALLAAADRPAVRTITRSSRERGEASAGQWADMPSPAEFLARADPAAADRSAAELRAVGKMVKAAEVEAWAALERCDAAGFPKAMVALLKTLTPEGWPLPHPEEFGTALACLERRGLDADLSPIYVPSVMQAFALQHEGKFGFYDGMRVELAGYARHALESGGPAALGSLIDQLSKRCFGRPGGGAEKLAEILAPRDPNQHVEFFRPDAKPDPAEFYADSLKSFADDPSLMLATLEKFERDYAEQPDLAARAAALIEWGWTTEKEIRERFVNDPQWGAAFLESSPFLKDLGAFRLWPNPDELQTSIGFLALQGASQAIRRGGESAAPYQRLLSGEPPFGAALLRRLTEDRTDYEGLLQTLAEFNDKAAAMPEARRIEIAALAQALREDSGPSRLSGGMREQAARLDQAWKAHQAALAAKAGANSVAALKGRAEAELLDLIQTDPAEAMALLTRLKVALQDEQAEQLRQRAEIEKALAQGMVRRYSTGGGHSDDTMRVLREALSMEKLRMLLDDKEEGAQNKIRPLMKVLKFVAEAAADPDTGIPGDSGLEYLINEILIVAFDPFEGHTLSYLLAAGHTMQDEIPRDLAPALLPGFSRWVRGLNFTRNMSRQQTADQFRKMTSDFFAGADKVGGPNGWHNDFAMMLLIDADARSRETAKGIKEKDQIPDAQKYFLAVIEDKSVPAGIRAAVAGSLLGRLGGNGAEPPFILGAMRALQAAAQAKAPVEEDFVAAILNAANRRSEGGEYDLERGFLASSLEPLYLPEEKVKQAGAGLFMTIRHHPLLPYVILALNGGQSDLARKVVERYKDHADAGWIAELIVHGQDEIARDIFYAQGFELAECVRDGDHGRFPDDLTLDRVGGFAASFEDKEDGALAEIILMMMWEPNGSQAPEERRRRQRIIRIAKSFDAAKFPTREKREVALDAISAHVIGASAAKAALQEMAENQSYLRVLNLSDWDLQERRKRLHLAYHKACLSSGDPVPLKTCLDELLPLAAQPGDEYAQEIDEILKSAENQCFWDFGLWDEKHAGEILGYWRSSSPTCACGRMLKISPHAPDLSPAFMRSPPRMERSRRRSTRCPTIIATPSSI